MAAAYAEGLSTLPRVPSASIEFPILPKITVFGTIPDALIPAVLQTRRGPLPLQFILDTGADFTMLPHHMAETPYLLGRADLFSAFSIAFDTRRRKIRFSPRIKLKHAP